jgi:hypothetical protein
LLDLPPSEARSIPIIGLLHDGIIGISKFFISHPSTGAESNAGVAQWRGRVGPNESYYSCPKTFVMATFDIYQRRFVLEDYRLPGSLWGVQEWRIVLEQAFYWRKQIAFPFPEEYITAQADGNMPRGK